MLQDDIPPLEDMTALVDKVKEKQKSVRGANTSVKSSSPSSDNSTKVSLQNSSHSRSTKKSDTGTGYGGMKKGFLFGNNSTSKTAKKSASKKSAIEKKVDYEVKPKTGANSNLVFDEVQSAVKENVGLGQNKEWVTDDLLKKVEGNKTLFSKLADPKFSKALEMMQKDPKSAKDYYKNDKEVQEFFMEFYNILGQHFTTLGEQSDTRPKKSEEEIQFEKTISRPDIKEILSKPAIKTLFTTLRDSPKEGQRLFHSSDQSLKADIQKLVEAGLLNFESRPHGS